MAEYKPEIYWSEVAEEIKRRGESYIAGDDNPSYRYKRRMFLKKFLDTIDFQDRTVLEVGFGPGGNLKHIATHHRPRKLRGVDVSAKMLEIASKNLSSYQGRTQEHRWHAHTVRGSIHRYHLHGYGLTARHGRDNVPEHRAGYLQSDEDDDCPDGGHWKKHDFRWRE